MWGEGVIMNMKHFIYWENPELEFYFAIKTHRIGLNKMFNLIRYCQGRLSLSVFNFDFRFVDQIPSAVNLGDRGTSINVLIH